MNTLGFNHLLCRVIQTPAFQIKGCKPFLPSQVALSHWLCLLVFILALVSMQTRRKRNTHNKCNLFLRCFAQAVFGHSNWEVQDTECPRLLTLPCKGAVRPPSQIWPCTVPYFWKFSLKILQSYYFEIWRGLPLIILIFNRPGNLHATLSRYVKSFHEILWKIFRVIPRSDLVYLF